MTTPLKVQIENGEDSIILGWACRECKKPYLTEQYEEEEEAKTLAQSCCPRVCLECGVSIPVKLGWSCYACADKVHRQHVQFLFDKATKEPFEGYEGAFYDPYTRVRYENVDELAATESREHWPTFVWPASQSRFSLEDAARAIVEAELEELGGDLTIEDVPETQLELLQGMIDLWANNAPLGAACPDISRALVL